MDNQERSEDSLPIANEPEEDIQPQPSTTEPLSDSDWLTQPPDAEGTPPSSAPTLEVNATVEWNTEDQEAALPFPVVGIGASAGGLQAFRELLEHLPEQTGMAYVLISHLAPDKRSYLADILSRHTSMPVHGIEEGAQPRPNELYVLQPGQIALLQRGAFRLEQRGIGERVHFPIDEFFRSLGSDQKSWCVGVVLSGADSDGALGLKSIKGDGGLSIAQAPETAQQAGMPTSSIEMDHVDFVGSPAEIGVELGRLAGQFTLPQIRSLGIGESVSDQEHTLQQILQVLRNATGLDLRQYKPETIRRRIARRMVVRRIDSLAEYARLLQIERHEVRALYEDSLINVTRFFRDPEFWHAFSTQVLPSFFQERAPERPVRIWCPGCATGEEAYSLAIAAFEYLKSNGLDTTVQIFATDASEQAVDKARAAVYPDSLIGEISPERLRRFFTKVDRGYQVSKRVRDCCIFARQNLANDPPFSHIDLLSCRNVLIYFNQSLQKQVIRTFHYALEPDGYLLLGASESLRDYGDYFQAFDRKNKVYSRIGAPTPSLSPARSTQAIGYLPPAMRARYASPSDEVWTENDLQRAADRIVLAHYAPPGFIVDDRMKVLQARGQTAPYVEVAPGSVSWNLSRLLHGGIASDVREAVEQAIREDIPVSVDSTILTENAGQQALRVEVLPIASATARARCFLVLFSGLQDAQRASVFEPFALPEPTLAGTDRAVSQMRQDLTATRFHLQSLIEERDARNQELVSANEEIQSANEELQSTNEELETTKEELQSTNEELQTVNDELRQRNAILAQTGNDLTNLLNSVNMPLLMLTEELKIRQFTPPMERMLNIRASDIGRAISEIRLQLSVENIEPILLEVLDTLGARELEVQDRDGKWSLLRIRPYRTADNKIEGLVVLLVDIDQLRSSQQELRAARDFASSVIQSVPTPLVVVEMDGSIRTNNKAFGELMQMTESDLAGRYLPDLARHLWGLTILKNKLEELSQAAPGTVLEFEHQTPQEQTLQIQGQALPIDGSRVLLLTVEDVSQRRDAERTNAQQQTALRDEVEARGKTLLRTQEELRQLAAHLFTMQEDERQRVARELHDDISQRLSRIEILCARAEQNDGQKLSSIRAEVQSLNTDVREISHRLHPAILNDLGLSAALKALVEDFHEKEGMPATWFEVGSPEKLPQSASTALYRICQEALRNVRKHAGETHVKVTLESEDHSVRMRIRDFGIGFDQDTEYPTRGLGLISMEERARIAGGTFSISASLGNGTVIEVVLPIKEHE